MTSTKLEVMFIFKAYRKKRGHNAITIFIKFDCNEEKYFKMVDNFIDFGYELKKDTLKNYLYYRSVDLSSIICYNITERNYQSFTNDLFSKHRL